MIRSFYSRIDKIAESNWDSLTEELIWKERIEKAVRFRAKADRYRCIAAGVLLQRVVMNIQDYSTENDLTVRQAKNGKPFFPELNGVHFNISHSGNYVVCAVGNEEVGIDVEVRQKDYMKIARNFFTEKEFLWICNAEGSEQDLRFLRMWTLKESYVKMTGMGLTEKLNGFEIIPPDLNTEKHQSLDGLSINCSVIISGNPEAVNFCEYFIDDVNIAVCSHDNIETKIEEIRL
ncbi:MAG: 4'-phosphopantetheinyl transferase superfamily protein [Sphaerochaetaceae bacterium]|nr:4'-phosphopantetheinyl transferase superfamily protein [Sphaerochaetaceae bacterium]